MRISAFIPVIDNPRSLVRGHGVLSELHRVSDEPIELKIYTGTKVDNTNPDSKILFEGTGDFDIRLLKGTDIVFFMKPDTEVQLEAIETCKEYNFKVVLDYDDDMFSIPETNPYVIEQKRNNNDYKKYAKKCIELADHIIVSTEHIKENFKPLNQNITVINNSFDDYCFKLATELSQKKIVLWRGGLSHTKDLFLFQDQIIDLIKNNQDYTFVFWSNDSVHPAWLINLAKEQKNIALEDAVSSFYYFLNLRYLNPFLTIVPLEDNEFNKGKSDLAKIEAVASGGLCLCPRNSFKEWIWDTNENMLYGDNKGFYFKAKTLLDLHRSESIQNNALISNYWQSDIDYLKKEKLLSNNNIKRLEVFRSVLK